VQHVTVRVPASTSNLGPGFDCLGIALQIYNEITLAREPATKHTGLVSDAATAFFSTTKRKRFDFSCTISGQVPIARGLGSSATIRVGVLHGLNELARSKLTRRHIFALAAELEQHPDNAAPATFGGFTVTRERQVLRFSIAPRLVFVLLIPEIEISTKKARAILPRVIARTDAVRSAGNAAALAAAFAGRAYETLRGNFWDALHQPYRRQLVPHLDDCIAAAEQAGALGAFLSGSGSAICAIALGNAKRIASAMRLASRSDARVIITRADNRGARIVSSKRR
jgi:homoserine kinase